MQALSRHPSAQNNFLVGHERLLQRHRSHRSHRAVIGGDRGDMPSLSASHHRLYGDPSKQSSSGLYQPAALPQPLASRPSHHHQPRPAQESTAAFGSSPLPGVQPTLKYAQMGHSSYGRGAPHVCYLQMDSSHGLFYSRAHQEQGQHSPGWMQLAAKVSHAATNILQGSSRGSVRAGAAAADGAAAAVSPDSFIPTPQKPAGFSLSGTSSDPSGGVGADEVRPQWHVVLFQALILAAALLVTGLLLKHFFRSVVAALVACYSGLFFKA